MFWILFNVYKKLEIIKTKIFWNILTPIHDSSVSFIFIESSSFKDFINGDENPSVIPTEVAPKYAVKQDK